MPRMVIVLQYFIIKDYCVPRQGSLGVLGIYIHLCFKVKPITHIELTFKHVDSPYDVCVCVCRFRGSVQ